MNELENYLMGKEAETTGTSLMPTGASTNSDVGKSLTKTIPKVAESIETVGALEKNEGQPGEQVKQLPQANVRVDTTGKEAPIVGGGTKEAQHYALPSHGRYPLDSYAHVKVASAYFDEHSRRMVPEMRREYCSNLVKRATALGIRVSDEARKYGAEGYAPDAQVESAISMRAGCIKEAMYLKGLEYLTENRKSMEPEAFAIALGEFDKVAGVAEYYDKDVPDPYWTTFGEKKADDDGALLVGNDYISQEELKNFAKVHSCKLKDMFGEDFSNEFRKDPVGITKSLPVDQKKMVIRLASSTLTDPTST